MVRSSELSEAFRLFNENFYFEAHDALEELWAEERGRDRAFLQSLVHVAVGMVHVSNENHRGAVNLLSRAIEGLKAFVPTHRGLDVAALIERAGICLEKSENALAGIPPVWSPEDRPTMRWVEGRE